MADDAEPGPSLPVKDWVAAVAHDLRDPMNAIVGMTDLLLLTPLDPQQQRYAEALKDASATMLTLIADLLDVNRLERGDLHVLHEPFDVRLAVGRSLDWLRPRIGARSLRLIGVVDDAVPTWVMGDPGRLRQVLLNLVGNALKFTTDGEVRLEVMPLGADGMLRFRVADTGRGMDRQALDRLRRPFVQLEAGDRQQGLGLGLTITRHLVAGMGGRIAVASAAGRGTTVTVDLPLPATAEPAPLAPPPLDRRRVTVVGGQGEVGRLLGERLRSMGVTPEVVVDPAEMLRGLARAEGAPDALLVVCDAVRAETGAALARWRAAAARPNLPALALVAAGVRGEAGAAREAGFDGYLPQTAAADVLAAALGRLWDGTAAAEREFVTVHGLRERADGPWRLLVVDDNPMNVRLLQIVLERVGHEVETALDGETAVARAGEGRFDAVLMDLQMPGLSGFEATARIRGLAGSAGRVPIVAVTANAAGEVAARCLAVGMQGCLTKPIEPGRVQEALRLAVAADREPPAGG